MLNLVPVWALALCCALAGAPAFAQRGDDFDRIPTSLPKSVVPSRTDLTLTLDPAATRFGGDATIHVQVRERVAAIILHARELELQGSALLRGAGGGGPRELLAGEAPGVREAWALRPLDGAPITPGRYTLRLRYAGKVNVAGDGLFAVPYKGAAGMERMLATQMEATHARRVVPTFDAPLFRQVFQLDVLAPEGQEVFSNTPRVRRTLDNGMVRHSFAATPPMASYLLAVAVGRLDWIDDKVDGVALRIIAPAGRSQHGRFAMEATKLLLPYYRNYFGRAYPLPKLDQLAVPGVRVGAQEDWGLISYIESRLLVEPERDTPEARFSVHVLMAHEIAHQWFGNLVSAASWDDIWLNEAFAQWMQWKATDHFHPEWGTPLRRRGALEPTLASDATTATRPIRGGLVGEERVADVFDGITYQKGSAVVGMLEQWLGAEAFRRGLVSYMKSRAYKPATSADLWHHLALASGKPVAQVARYWTERPGLPAIGVSQSCEAGATRVGLTRKRFTTQPGIEDVPWAVPVRLAQGSAVRDVLLESAAQVVSWPGCDERPVVANAGGAGYYRVLPDEALHRRLVGVFQDLAPADQVAMLNDSYAFVQAGSRALREHFVLLEAVARTHREGRDSLFAVALGQWEQLSAIFRGLDAGPALQAAERRFLGPELARLGWEPRAGESAQAALLRSAVIRRLVFLEEPAAVEGVRERCAAAMANDRQRVAASVRPGVLVGCAAAMDDAAFAQLLQAYRSARSQPERALFLRALVNQATEARARQVLSLAAAGELSAEAVLSVPFFLAQSGSLDADGAYRLTLEFWEPLARLAGEATVGGKQRLLPFAAMGLSDEHGATRLLADQLRLMGEPGRQQAEREAAALRVRAGIRTREGAGLAGWMQDWAVR